MIQLERPVPVTEVALSSPPRRTDAERLQRRAMALQRLDPLIAPRLRRLLPLWLQPASTGVELTVYDVILPGSPRTGGQWMIAARWLGWLTHAVWSYTVLLDFDDREQPQRLRIRGQGEVVTEDFSEGGLDRAFTEAARAGPLFTGAAQAFVGISL